MKRKMLFTGILIVSLILSGCGAASHKEQDSLMHSDIPDEDYVSAESYLNIEENTTQDTAEETMLTFSLKVDTAAYSNITRYIENGSLPPADAVRTEELLNYFSYDGETTPTDSPFALSAEVGPSPSSDDKYIALIRVKTAEIEKEELPPSNLTFLIDTSGSMDSYNKLPLLKEAFSLLVETLDENDRVSIVTYAGSSEIVLDSMSGDQSREILDAIHRLEASGSTAGADGILTAYELAEKNYIEDGNNRIILATDGDFNVGTSDLRGLKKLVSQKRDNGVYMSLLGFGEGNLQDDTMETLSKNGNGNYLYIHSVSDAKKGLVDELGSNLHTVADDVKAQIEFNPENVKNYRLIGYENRRMSNEDFDDDTKDAGEIGAGTDVVMMFELELAETLSSLDQLFEIRIRYKDPGNLESELLTQPVFLDDIEENNSSDFHFACSVAGFGDLLRESTYAEDVTLSKVIALADENLGDDRGGYREAYLDLLSQYEAIIR